MRCIIRCYYKVWGVPTGIVKFFFTRAFIRCSYTVKLQYVTTSMWWRTNPPYVQNRHAYFVMIPLGRSAAWPPVRWSLLGEGRESSDLCKAYCPPIRTFIGCLVPTSDLFWKRIVASNFVTESYYVEGVFPPITWPNHWIGDKCSISGVLTVGTHIDHQSHSLVNEAAAHTCNCGFIHTGNLTPQFSYLLRVPAFRPPPLIYHLSFIINGKTLLNLIST